MNKKVSIIGIGMNGKKSLTAQALEAIRSADALIGAKRMTDSFSDIDKPVLISYDPAETAEFIKRNTHEKYAVLMSGDCGFSAVQKSFSHILPTSGQKLSAESPLLFISVQK